MNVRHKEDPYLKIGSVNDRASTADSEYVCTLKDIDFKVEQGDVIGIIGKNDLSKCTLIVPVGSKSSYETADGWKDFGTIVEDANISPGPEENEPTDISSYDYVLYFSETEVKSGTTSTLSLNLKNAAEDITAIQCDIYLPEDVE